MKGRTGMSTEHYRTSFTADRSPQDVFEAVTNPRGWWSQAIEGDTDRLGAVFYFHYRDVHRCTLKVTELVPGKKVVWRVLHNEFNFVKDRTEWIGSEIVFDIVSNGDTTELRFTHVGLAPADECYEVCSHAWGSYIPGSLRDLVVEGKGRPNAVEKP